MKAAREKAAIVRRPGLAFDIDTPNDLDLAMATGIPFKLD
jgi:2-phospho-L-lactate guanylyltransferase (CobY/MobA/RfbA family)